MMINPDDLSLFVVIVGVRGSGKTLLLTGLQRHALKQAATIRLLRQIKKNPTLFKKRKTAVFSNYPLKYYLKPEKLYVSRLIAWKPEYKDCWIYFDEIQTTMDRQDWSNSGAKMINQGLTVMRHRNISIACTIQSIEWLNARAQFQTDIIIKCRDLVFTPWGRANNVRPGEVISTTWLDKSGVMTGQTYVESHRVYQMRFFGKSVFNNYETQHEFDVMDLNTKYQVDRPVKRINRDGDIVDIDHDAYANARIQDILESTISFYQHSQPGERIPSREFWNKAREMGLQDNGAQTAQHWGPYLSKLGVQRKSYSGVQRYDFEGVQVV